MQISTKCLLFVGKCFKTEIKIGNESKISTYTVRIESNNR